MSEQEDSSLDPTVTNGCQRPVTINCAIDPYSCMFCHMQRGSLGFFVCFFSSSKKKVFKDSSVCLRHKPETQTSSLLKYSTVWKAALVSSVKFYFLLLRQSQREGCVLTPVSAVLLITNELPLPCRWDNVPPESSATLCAVPWILFSDSVRRIQLFPDGNPRSLLIFVAKA